MSIKTYSQLIRLPDYNSRLRFLADQQKVGEKTFGGRRYLNQELYRSSQWRSIRNHAIARDGGYDLALDGCEVFGKIIVHHICPLTPEDVEEWTDVCFDLENLITCSAITHNRIHYGDTREVQTDPVVRSPGDTKLWR